jgi:excinuclease ABC subunit A
VTYVLDEPSIGLHPRDNARLLLALRRCATAGTPCWSSNTTPRRWLAADYLVDVGPGAGGEARSPHRQRATRRVPALRLR